LNELPRIVVYDIEKSKFIKQLELSSGSSLNTLL